MSGPNGEDSVWLTELGMVATEPAPPVGATVHVNAPDGCICYFCVGDRYEQDPGPVPPEPAEPMFQSIAPRTWTRVLLPWVNAVRKSPLWVRNDADEHAFITIGADGTVGLQGGEGIRWLIVTGEEHPDLRGE